MSRSNKNNIKVFTENVVKSADNAEAGSQLELPNRVMVDPPSGWKYGFPKAMKPGVEYEDLLKQSGYPEKDIPLALKYSRWWTE